MSIQHPMYIHRAEDRSQGQNLLMSSVGSLDEKPDLFIATKCHEYDGDMNGCDWKDLSPKIPKALSMVDVLWCFWVYWNRLPATLTEQPQEHLHLLFDVHHCRFAPKISALEALQQPGSQTEQQDILLFKYGRPTSFKSLEFLPWISRALPACSFSRLSPAIAEILPVFLAMSAWWGCYHLMATGSTKMESVLCRKPKSLNREGDESTELSSQDW